MASLGLRTLAVCRASWDQSKVEGMDADIISKCPAPFLTMVGIVAILDPPRPEAIEAVGVANEVFLPSSSAPSPAPTLLPHAPLAWCTQIFFRLPCQALAEG